MMALALSMTAALGTFWVYTACALEWRGLGLGPRLAERQHRRISIDVWLTQAGLEDVDARQFVTVVLALSGVGWLGGYAVFGGLPKRLEARAFHRK